MQGCGPGGREMLSPHWTNWWCGLLVGRKECTAFTTFSSWERCLRLPGLGWGWKSEKQTNNPSFLPYEKPILPSSVQIIRFLVFNSEHKVWRLERKMSPAKQWREEQGKRLAAGRGETLCVWNPPLVVYSGRQQILGEEIIVKAEVNEFRLCQVPSFTWVLLILMVLRTSLCWGSECLRSQLQMKSLDKPLYLFGCGSSEESINEWWIKYLEGHSRWCWGALTLSKSSHSWGSRGECQAYTS